MTKKTYELSELERRTILCALQEAWTDHPLMELFAKEHPVDPEIVGRDAILNHLKESGFKGREPDALMMFTWGPGQPQWQSIMNGLNQFDVVTRLLRTPNVGTLTVRSLLLRCIAHGWIREAQARRAADRFLTETAAAAASERRTGSRARKL